MSTAPQLAKNEPTSKPFGKSQKRLVPHSSDRAQKWYPIADENTPRKTRKAIRPWNPRSKLQPGTILILLAGRFRGKRVVLIKTLDQGILLITGPFKINGVPLRRVNSRYVIATSQKVDLTGLNANKIEEVTQPKYFTADKAKAKGEKSFFQQGDKPKKREINASKAADQRTIDKPILANINKVEMLSSYLASCFSLRNGDKPHEMIF